jgi:outer membrane protein assembly factor BamB
MKISLELLLKTLPIVISIVGLLSVGYWFWNDPSRDFILSEPAVDGSGGSINSEENIIIGEFFELFSTTESTLRETWPRFRGANSDNISRSDIRLIDGFDNQSPQILWSVKLGEGHAGPAIYKGLVYILDYDENSRADMLRCFSLTSGEEIWRRWYDVEVRRNHGMSRTVPAVTENHILTIGPRGHVMCLERANGDFLWGIDIQKEFKSEIPLWYTGQCPIIENDLAIIATGGTSLMIGVDCKSGEILWETPNPNNWKMSHASVVPFEFGGRRMYVYSAVGGAVGVAADGPDAGSILWETSLWNNPVVAASAVCMPDGKIFLTAGYGAGSMLLQLIEENGSFSVELLKTIKPGEGLSSEQQTPIMVDGHLFGIMPKDARTFRNQMVCVNQSDPTEIVWSSGSVARFGLGPYILADNKFFLLNDDATLYIIQKSTKGFIELDKVKLFDGFDAWAPLAIADGYMVLRDSETMICINIKK